MKLTNVLETSTPSIVVELSSNTMKNYRKKAIDDAMTKHHKGGACNEIEACKRAKNIARSVRLELSRRNQIREAVMDMPLDAAKARLADLRDFLSSVPRNLTSQDQYDEVDDARDEIRELEAYIRGKSQVRESANTADASYQTRLSQCKELIQKLSQSLDAHAQKQQGNPASWGFAGDLAHIATQLEEILEFVNSGDEVTESEQLDELSKTTLQSYVVKRAKKHGDRQYDRANGDAFAIGSEVSRESRDKWTKNEKRAERSALRNIQRAASKLADPSYGNGRRSEENEEQGEFSPHFIQGVARGEVDLYDAMGQNTPDARALQRMYDVVAAENHLRPDDDYDAILDIIYDQISQRFGDL